MTESLRATSDKRTEQWGPRARGTNNRATEAEGMTLKDLKETEPTKRQRKGLQVYSISRRQSPTIERLSGEIFSF